MFISEALIKVKVAIPNSTHRFAKDIINDYIQFIVFILECAIIRKIYQNLYLMGSKKSSDCKKLKELI